MSGIDDLRNNAESQRVEIGLESGRHKVVLPKGMKEESFVADNRVTVDLTTETPAPEPPSDVRESYVKDILEGPNSMFEKWKNEKIEEYTERMATLEQENELKEQEIEEAEDSEGEFGMESVNENVTVASPEEVVVETTPAVEEVKMVEPEKIDIIPEVEKSPENIVKEEIEEEEIEAPEIDIATKEVDNTLATEIVEEEEESEVKDDDEDVLKHLQKLATEKLKPLSKSLDISSFTVLKKPTANIKSLTTEQVKAVKWVLPTTESVVYMKEFTGSELEKLREVSEDTSSISQLYRKYHYVYDHIVSSKPATYEQWLKTTPIGEIDHYFFAIFIACYKGANFIPLDCKNDKCKKTFISNDIPIMNMVKFENDTAKKKFVELYESEDVPAGKGIYCSEIVPLSNKIAVGFKDASIYSLLEVNALNDKDKDKFSTIIDYIPYIDAVYIIHEDTHQLEPVGYKIYPENATKTVKSKLVMFSKVLGTLTPDEFAPIRSYIRTIIGRTAGISYQIPSVACPYCGTETEVTPTTAEGALFTRLQISALVNTSLK